MEFATIFVGVLAVEVFGLTFGQAVAAIVLGNVLAAVAHGLLSARGPLAGVPQMVLGRLAFGYRGNVLPSALMTITSGFGWFAVNSVSASFALSSLTGASPGAVAGDRRARADRGGLPRAQPGAGVRALGVPGAGGGVPRRRGGGAGALRRLVRARGRRHGRPGRVPADRRRRVRLHRGLDAVRRGLHPLPARDRVALGHGPRRGHRDRTVVHRADDRRSGVGERGGPGRRHVGQPHHGLRRRAAGLARRAHVDRDRHRRGRRERPQHLLGGDGVPVDGDPGAPEAGARVRGAGVRGGRVPHRARSARRRGGQLRELPPGDRLLDRAVARRDARRPVAAARPHAARAALRPLVHATRPG